MRTGQRNTPVAIYQFTETGADADTNLPVMSRTVWKSNIFCHVDSRRGKEISVDGQPTSEAFVRFHFQSLDITGMTELMQIDVEGRTYDVKAIMPDMNYHEMTLVDAVQRVRPTGRP